MSRWRGFKFTSPYLCTSVMVSHFRGYIKIGHLMLKCPKGSRCCGECPLFYPSCS